jgi:hypothetical protein
LFISRLLACKYSFTRNLSSPYQTLRRKNGMQYQSKCNIFNSFGNALLFIGKLVKISANIVFLFYKEIYMKYLILYYKSCYPSNWKSLIVLLYDTFLYAAFTIKISFYHVFFGLHCSLVEDVRMLIIFTVHYIARGEYNVLSKNIARDVSQSEKTLSEVI